MYHLDRDFDRLGYTAGIMAEEPDSRAAFGAAERDAYFLGYARGIHERRNEPSTMIPEWMSPEQAQAVCRLYLRNPDGSVNRQHFFSRVQNYSDYCGFAWCGMFIGIEKDGYTHS